MPRRRILPAASSTPAPPKPLPVPENPLDSPVDEEDKPCLDARDQDCKCASGYQCHTPSCNYCLRLPTCTAGQTIRRRGAQQYTYECMDCEEGTYYVLETGLCMPNFTEHRTAKPGKKNHDAQCEREPSLVSLFSVNSAYAVPLAVLMAVSIFILILMTVFLHLYIWRVKRRKSNATAGLEPFPLTFHPHPPDDTCSCPFPEEEKGERSREEETLKSFV